MLTLVLGIIALFLIGAIAGILGGLLGIGGGVVTVPALFFLFHFLGYPQAYLMHMAIGTSLAAMVFNTLASTLAHHRKKGVMWGLVRKMLPGILIGSVLGAFSADLLSGVILEIVFGVFLCLLGLFFLRRIHPSPAPHRLPSSGVLNLISAGIGWVSNLLGIGGGVITMPTLTAFRIPSKIAIGTSAAFSFFITCFGTASYLYVGWGEVSLSDTVGFINLPAFVIIGIAALLSAPYGAKLTHRLSDQVLRRIFGAVLIVVGVTMLK